MPPDPRFPKQALWRALRDALGRFFHHAPPEKQKEINMATIKQSLDELMKLDGILCIAIVDSGSGMLLGSAGGGINIEVAAAANTEVVRAKLKAMRALGLNDKIEDILITLGKQYPHPAPPLCQGRRLPLRRIRPPARQPGAGPPQGAGSGKRPDVLKASPRSGCEANRAEKTSVAQQPTRSLHARSQTVNGCSTRGQRSKQKGFAPTLPPFCLRS